MMIDHTYTDTDDALANPERGLYHRLDLVADDAAEVACDIRRTGATLGHAMVRLDAYRDRPLDDGLLVAIARGLGAVRGAGLKVIVRFAYNAGFAADAPRARVLDHIGQLAPVLRAGADAIAVVQAGFIGAWGEWHHSTSGLDNDDDRAEILTALLDAVPPSRAVQVRTPMFKEAAFPGGPLTEDTAFGATPRARVGHHNDCFLADRDDAGTYARPIQQWRDYVAADGRFVVIGGETCAANPPRTDCAAAIAEMERQHWSYLNAAYAPRVLSRWRAQGCHRAVAARLGYRLSVHRLVCDAAVAPGGALSVELAVANRGFAAPFNARPALLVLTTSATRHVARLSDDPRRWGPGTTAVRARLRVPADVAPGRYRLAIWLPDAADALRGDPRYAIRLASTTGWDPSTGDNVLTDELCIDASASATDHGAPPLAFERVRGHSAVHTP